MSAGDALSGKMLVKEAVAHICVARGADEAVNIAVGTKADPGRSLSAIQILMTL
jgi:hypothetical protein